MIERINTQTLPVEEKERVRMLRAYPGGVITLSLGTSEQLGLEEGDRIEFFTSKDDLVVRMFISKSGSQKGFLLKNQNNGGLRMRNINLSKMLISFFGMEKEEKSLAMRVYPQPYEFREYNGYVPYQIIRK